MAQAAESCPKGDREHEGNADEGVGARAEDARALSANVV